jgi:hypothetical protein
MWAKLDDALIDHRKIFVAGKIIGVNGPAIALGFYAVGLLWTSKHLTDGFLPEEVIEGFQHVKQPLTVAGALVKAELFDKAEGGFKIHNFHEWNPSASALKKKKKEDRLRKQRERNGG